MPAALLNMKPPTPVAMKYAVTYARVSSKDQEETGFSIPAQQRLLREHATTNGLIIRQDFVDVETARRSGRTAFGELLTYIKKHPRTIILVEKTDRLYRNIKDWATLDEHGVTIHFVKENVIISPESRSADQFMHGIRVLMAKQYSANLSEETRKGQTEKARGGIYPSFAPAGYQNVDGPNGKRIITPQPTEASIITELFTLFSTGNYSLEQLVQCSRARGMTLRGKKLQRSTLHQILRKRIYTGKEFDYDGVTYQGTHEGLVTKETWDSVQRILDARKAHQLKGSKRSFPFTGLITCGKCGCAMVAELKTKKSKKTYVYYHCTGNRGKCGDPFTRQEILTNEFASTLSELVIPPDILDWLSHEINSADQNEQGARDAVIKRLEAERSRVHHRQSTLYDDKLDGKIANTLWEEKSSQLQAQADEIDRKLSQARETALVPLTTALDLARLTSNACNSFREQNEEEQRKLLVTILKEATWQDGGLRTTLLEPFEQLRRSNQLSTTKDNGNGGSGRDMKIWLLG